MNPYADMLLDVIVELVVREIANDAPPRQAAPQSAGGGENETQADYSMPILRAQIHAAGEPSSLVRPMRDNQP